MTFRWMLSLLLLLGLSACASNEATDEEYVDPATECLDGRCDFVSHSKPPIDEPQLMINELETLNRLDQMGYSLAAQLDRDPQSLSALATSSPVYRTIVDTVAADIAEFKSRDSNSGVGLAYAHRLFDARWLRSSATRFRLLGVVQRLDQAFATPNACGEVRFIYRLMYTKSQGSSRLPMTLMLVREMKTDHAGGCSMATAAWRDQDGSPRALLDGPLALLGPVVRVEINLQSVRWPVIARPDLGGHAEYLLRVFDVDGDAARPALLRDTVRTDLDADEREQLRQWILANTAAIDNGTAIVPEQFLDDRVVSVSPRGLSRASNRPYAQLYRDAAASFGHVDFTSLSQVKSPEGLLRRLDTMTCQGCHQSRGLAGFHWLGQENDVSGAARNNALEVGSSPHLNDELVWRRAVLDAMADGQSVALPRPFAERNASVPGIYGAHCGLGDPTFASWTCAHGYECADLNGDEVGMCVRSGTAMAGEACETSGVTFDPDSHRDRVVGMQLESCVSPTGGSASCSRSSNKPGTLLGGFPNGACAGSCAVMGSVRDNSICGAKPPAGFNDCIGSGSSFVTCLQGATPTYRRRCDAATPCGDDYVCAALPVAGLSGVGACMPPYFIFQARVDGHAVPQ